MLLSAQQLCLSPNNRAPVHLRNRCVYVQLSTAEQKIQVNPWNNGSKEIITETTVGFGKVSERQKHKADWEKKNGILFLDVQNKNVAVVVVILLLSLLLLSLFFLLCSLLCGYRLSLKVYLAAKSGKKSSPIKFRVFVNGFSLILFELHCRS